MKRDSRSSGERTGKSPNRASPDVRGCRASIKRFIIRQGKRLGRRAIEGESPVPETERDAGGT